MFIVIGGGPAGFGDLGDLFSGAVPPPVELPEGHPGNPAGGAAGETH